MLATGDYRAPRPVLIDLGFATRFVEKGRRVCGTAGYIPPETWETGHWYPTGDVFSMGIVIFQLMIGQVPSASGSQCGVMLLRQLSGEVDEHPSSFARAAKELPLPWDRWAPTQWPQLRQLAEWMTQKHWHARPRAPQALDHPWFSSSSDAPLPPETLRRLLEHGSGASARPPVSALGCGLSRARTAPEMEEAAPQGEALAAGPRAASSRFPSHAT